MSIDLEALLKTPARQQLTLEELEADDPPPQTGLVFNVWFQKWSGGGSSSNQITKAKHKLDVDRDTGYTRASKLKNNSYICLYYAKGICVKGKECEYLHRIPQDSDFWPQTVDCFGREKFSEYRDDMAGIGSFNTVNKTLFIGGNVIIKRNFQDLLNENFQKLGKIEKINVINNKNCAFISFKNESSAQFAREVMMGQSLYGEDILVLKWANEDPNPTAKNLKKRQLEKDTEDMVKGLLAKFDNENKKAKVVEEEFDMNNAQVEDLEEEEPQEKPAVTETKSIEPAPKKLVNNNSLEFLKLLKNPPVKSKQALVNSYDSDSDSD